MVKIAIPNKGRLSEGALDILKCAGLNIKDLYERKLIASTDDKRFQLLFVRARDIPEFVQAGVADVGITGLDLVKERGANVDIALDLGFGSCELAIAIRDDSEIGSVDELPDGLTVATTFPNLTADCFKRLGKKIRIVPVSGATEIAPHIGVADLIVDLVSTGSTLRLNGMKKIGTILKSSAVVITSPRRMEDEEIRSLVYALESVVNAKRKKYLMANVSIDALEEVRSFLPGIDGPTVVNIAGNKKMVAIHVVVDEDRVYDSISRLKELGATGILILQIDRMVP